MQLPKQMLKAIPKDYFDGARGTLKLLWEDEWRGLGITQVSYNRVCDATIRDADAHILELGMGALRGSRTGATHPSVQVSGAIPPSSCRPLLTSSRRPINFQPGAQ